MQSYLPFIVFGIILFLYIQIIQHYARSEDLEIYEMDYINNAQLQDVCNMKQPVIFNYANIHPEFMENVSISNILNKCNQTEIKIKDVNDYWKEKTTNVSGEQYYEPVDYFTLPFTSSHSFMKSDAKSLYFSENNSDFIEETGLDKIFQECNYYLKPPNFIIQTKYDIGIGSIQTETPLRYHTDYRKFMILSQGKIHVKMTHFKSSKYLKVIKDYDNYEYRSPINVWTPQEQYMNDISKIKFIEFDVFAGQVLYIPPYWWYSIRFSNNPNTVVSTISYNSIINILANAPDICRYFLQQQNIQKTPVKKMVHPSPSTTNVSIPDKTDISTSSNNPIETVIQNIADSSNPNQIITNAGVYSNKSITLTEKKNETKTY